VVYDGSIYIAARLADPPKGGADAKAIRFFKLDRVEEAKPSSRSFERPTETVESMLADSMTIFRSTKAPRRYRIRIDATRARWAVEKPFHPGQKAKPQRDGGVILEIERAWDDEMIPQLLGLAEHAEVLEPADVGDRIAETAERIAARYRSRGPARVRTRAAGSRRRQPAAMP
jgi:predicted DNA-binding transcriptional regulator YafY